MKIKDITEKCYNENNEWRTCHRIMKKLHNALGIDWTKPYIEIEHEGKFTVRSLNSELALKGCNLDDSLVLALVQGTNSWDSGEWRVVRIYNNGFDIDMPYIVDRFYRKYDFDDARKNERCSAIFFAQEKKYLTGSEFAHRSWGGYDHHKKAEDRHERFKVQKEYGYTYAGGFTNPDMDKSGYILNVYHDELEQRLRVYKKNKDRNAYLMADNTDKISTLDRLITRYREKLSKAILDADTLDKINEIDHKLSWGGLYSIMSTFNTFKKKTLDKSYDSIAESDKDYDYVAKKCYEYVG